MTDNLVSCSLISIFNGRSPSNHIGAFIYRGRGHCPCCIAVAYGCGQSQIHPPYDDALGKGADYSICKVFVISCGYFVTSSFGFTSH